MFWILESDFVFVMFMFTDIKKSSSTSLCDLVLTETNRITRQTDRQLLQMLAAQVFVIKITTLPLSINQLYVSFTSSFTKITLRVVQENLVARIVGTISYFPHSSSFYSYTLTGTVFRKEFIQIIRQDWHIQRNVCVRRGNKSNVGL